MTRELRAEVCVIGCGPAGITVARCLVDGGLDVLVVESGGQDYQPATQDLLDGTAHGPVIKDFPDYLRDSRRCQVGGAGSRWGTGPRPWLMDYGAEEFAVRDWLPHSGWPFPSAELAKYATLAAEALRISPFESLPSDPPPASMPSDPPQGRTTADPPLTDRLAARRYHFPTEPGVLRADFERLCRAPNFRAELGCTVLHPVVQDGAVAELAAVAGGEPVRIRADRFVLATGGVENGRLLLLAVDRHGRPAEASRIPALGRFFMEHFHVVAGRVRLPADAGWLPYLASRPDPALGHEVLNVLQLPVHTRQRERLLGATGQLAARQPDLSQPTIECDLFVRAEQAPNPASRLRLDERRRDGYGRPRAYLEWLPVAADWTSIARTAELMLAGLRTGYGIDGQLLIRLDRPWPDRPASPSQSDRPTWGHHHIGTTRMHHDPEQGVVDADGRVHGLANLYLAGSSVFPTSGYANPTFMIVTLATRLADHLLRTW